MSDYREIRYEVDEQIATITFNRPERRNPISVDMLGEVMDAVRVAQQDDAVRVLVMTGAGRAFCSGGDVKSMAQVASAGGGAWLLPRIVGLTHALDLILSGEPIDAETALRIGLVSRVVPADQLPAATREFARRFALSAPRGVEVAKRTVLRGLEMSFEAALDFIRPQLGALRQTEDHKEGLRALQERRPPRFQGR